MPYVNTANLQAILNGYVAALEADALNPQPTYTAPDGTQVDRDQWRDSLLKAVASANALLVKLNPYVVRTKFTL